MLVGDSGESSEYAYSKQPFPKPSECQFDMMAEVSGRTLNRVKILTVLR